MQVTQTSDEVCEKHDAKPLPSTSAEEPSSEQNSSEGEESCRAVGKNMTKCRHAEHAVLCVKSRNGKQVYESCLDGEAIGMRNIQPTRFARSTTQSRYPAQVLKQTESEQNSSVSEESCERSRQTLKFSVHRTTKTAIPKQS